MPKRRADDDDNDPEWVWNTASFAMGHLSQLTDKDPPGKPYEPMRGPLGFCIDPEAYKSKPKRRKRK
jgi:hypothetical protein